MDTRYNISDEEIAKYAKAIGHPARVAILRYLASRESCFFGDIHEVLPITKATVSKHLSELKDAELIQGEIMPPKVKYCLNKDNWARAKQLLSALLTVDSSAGCCCD